jgi:hypothetical protein
MLTIRHTGYTGVAVENGKYYLLHRSLRYETNRVEYEETQWHDRISDTTVVTMGLSLLGLIGMETLLPPRRRIFRRRKRRPLPSNRL